MAGGLSMVGSSVVDPHASPCLCLNALHSSNLNRKIGGDLALQRNWNSIGRKHLSRRLSSPFIHSGHQWRLLLLSKASKDSKKHGRKPRGLVIINEVAGQYEDSFEDVKSQLLNYFTYKAIRTVLNQLYEMNPTKYRWFYDFVATNKLSDGNRFIRTLVKERQDLAERVMITRLHLYGKWVKKCNHAEIYKEISDQNLELMRERLMETVIWPSDDTNTEKIG